LLINATALLYCSIPASVEAQLTPNQAAAQRALSQQTGPLKNFANTTPQNLDLCAPDELTSVDNEDVSAASGQIVYLKQRLATVRAGSTGSSLLGSSMNGNAPSFSAGLAGVTGPEGKGGPSEITSIPENRWGVFVNGIGNFVKVADTPNAFGFYLRTGGVIAGVDYRVGSNFVIGLTAGYSHTGGDLTVGSLDINTEIVGLYATAFSSGFYLDAAVTGNFSQYDTQRTTCWVNVTNGQPIGTPTASGSTDGFDLNVLVAGGYDWKTGNLSIGPTAEFQYTYVSVDGFTESAPSVPQGEAVLKLKINDQHPTSILTAFGMKASYDWKVGGILIKPEVRAAWLHEYAETTYSIVSSFVAQPGVNPTTLQPVTGPAIGHDRVRIAAGATVLWNERISTNVFYVGEFANNYQFNGVFGGFRVTF
jgi:uncharacterized protein with beta-barrel porin domain